MNWQSLLSPEIQTFIKENETADVSALALKKPPNSDWDYPLILDQIKARQKAKIKCPDWLKTENIVFPSADVMEQASSSATARYKASLINGETFADLTGGTGADSTALLNHFKRGFIIDKEKDNAQRLAHNIPRLVPKGRTVIIDAIRAEGFVKTMPSVDVIIIDPQRRDQNQKGKFKLEESSPDILALLPALFEKTDQIMIKTSPMLDIIKTLKDLGQVRDVHILEWIGDCKELIFVLDKNHTGQPNITAVQIDANGKALKSLTFQPKEEQSANVNFSDPQNYIYEPGPAFQKSGAFKFMAEKFGLQKLAAQTHIYTSDDLKPEFPGRVFKVIDQYPFKNPKLPFSKANIITRNFPLNPPELKKKLKIDDGGDEFLIGCTLENGSKTLIHARKA